MRNTFRGYYRPTQEEFSDLWENCLFVLDANVLLNIYRFTPSTSEDFIRVLKKISDRLWVPYQAALEYQMNRLDVINQQVEAYDKIQESLSKNKNKIISDLKLYKKHPYMQIASIIEKIEGIFSEINEDLTLNKQKHPNLIDDDKLGATITNLLDGRVGPVYPPDKLEKIYILGKHRYDNKIPPGFKDSKKENNEQYGDLILWCQIVSHAKSTNKPIILITDDSKDDWWRKSNGKIIGPHPELINEMLSITGQNFYIYQTEKFLEFANEYIQSSIKQETIDEVREIKDFVKDLEALKTLGFEEEVEISDLNKFLKEKENSRRIDVTKDNWEDKLSKFINFQDSNEMKKQQEYIQSLDEKKMKKLIEYLQNNQMISNDYLDYIIHRKQNFE